MKFHWIEEHTREFDSLDVFKFVCPKATILSIDGKDVIGNCEGCGKPILDGENHQVWHDGVITCEEHSEVSA